MTPLRTPDARFENLPDYAFAPHYTEIDNLRLHHVDEGQPNGEVVLLMHGEPSWSYLYRHMIPIIAGAGHRAMAPDLPGFGKSDKLPQRSAYSYQRFVDWMVAWLLANDLDNITLVCQDWGSLIGLRMLTAQPERFRRVVLANGGLPVGRGKMPAAFARWREFSQTVPQLPVSRIVNMGTVTNLSPQVLAAYDAPFPDESYKEAARMMPVLVPATPDDPAVADNEAAWQVLRTFTKPFLTAFSDQDLITRGGERPFQKLVPGAKGQPHTTITDAGHFLQEDKGPELAQVVLDFMV